MQKTGESKVSKQHLRRVSLCIDLPADLATNDLFPSSSVHILPGSVRNTADARRNLNQEFIDSGVLFASARSSYRIPFAPPSLPASLPLSLHIYIYMNVYVCISFSEMFFLEEKHSISISRSRGQLSLFSNMQQIQVIVKQRVLTKNIEVNRLLRCILSRRKCGTHRNRVSK